MDKKKQTKKKRKVIPVEQITVHDAIKYSMQTFKHGIEYLKDR